MKVWQTEHWGMLNISERLLRSFTRSLALLTCHILEHITNSLLIRMGPITPTEQTPYFYLKFIHFFKKKLVFFRELV